MSMQLTHIKTDTEDYYEDDQHRRHGVHKSYYPSGKLYFRCFYLDNNRQGEYKRYRENGQLHLHCFYVNGICHGAYKLYHRNGQLRSHGFYVDGEYHCEHKSYQYNGQLDRHRFYANNVEVTNEVNQLVSDITNINDEEKLVLKLQLGFNL